METQVVGNLEGSMVEFDHARGLNFKPRSSNRDWLPAPAFMVKRSEVARKRQSKRLRIPAESRAENKMLGLLMLGAATGVAYGFWMLMQFVENWAGFQAGIRRLVE